MIVPKNNTQTPRPDDCEWHPERLQLAQSIAASDGTDLSMHRALKGSQRVRIDAWRWWCSDEQKNRLTQVAFS